MRTPTDARSGYGAPAATALDPWARHAFASNGFGGATLAVGVREAPGSDEVIRAARAQRSRAMGDALIATLRAMRAFAQRAYASHLPRRRARELYDMLRTLDDRMLHDLGLDRSELTSVAAEATGGAEHTRAQTIVSTYGLPG